MNDDLVGSFGERYVEGYSLENHMQVDILDAFPLPDSL